MNKCPICGKYMSSHMEPTHDGAMVVWECPCGYTNKNDSYVSDNKTHVAEKDYTRSTKIWI